MTQQMTRKDPIECDELNVVEVVALVYGRSILSAPPHDPDAVNYRYAEGSAKVYTLPYVTFRAIFGDPVTRLPPKTSIPIVRR